MGGGALKVGDQHQLYKPVHLVFHYRCGRGSTATCNRSLRLDFRIVPWRWRGLDKHGGG